MRGPTPVGSARELEWLKLVELLEKAATVASTATTESPSC
jgi:hypothetical protein